ncbi:transmembrane protein [Anaeramoeba flamelloides]|uniref:Transmembrane protein n=1 Tax=Anaeramoeba flamelloides TaxID=1746091 RepID=A0ABQ8ZBC6_9EUKA|nr:transmembrane protein [Anaeramoeba flamelloides]
MSRKKEISKKMINHLNITKRKRIFNEWLEYSKKQIENDDLKFQKYQNKNKQKQKQSNLDDQTKNYTGSFQKFDQKKIVLYSMVLLLVFFDYKLIATRFSSFLLALIFSFSLSEKKRSVSQFNKKVCEALVSRRAVSIGIVVGILLLSYFLSRIIFFLALITIAIMLFVSRLGDRNTGASILLTYFTALVVVVPVCYALFTLSSEYKIAIEKLSGFEKSHKDTPIYQKICSLFLKFGYEAPDFTKLKESLSGVFTSPLIIEKFGGSVKSLFSLADLGTSIILFLFSLFVMLHNSNPIIKEIASISPLNKEETNSLLSSIRTNTLNIVTSSALIGIINGIISWFIFLVNHVPMPKFFAIISGFLSALPFVGSAIVWAPFAGFFYLQENYFKAFFITAIQLVCLFVLNPRIYKRLPSKNSFIGKWSIILGVSAFGAKGVFFGPFLIGLTLQCYKIYKNRRNYDLKKEN